MTTDKIKSNQYKLYDVSSPRSRQEATAFRRVEECRRQTFLFLTFFKES